MQTEALFEVSELERLVHEMGQLNEAFFPAQIIFAAIAVILTWWCFTRPEQVSSKLMKGFLALLYGLIAYGVTICFFNLQGIYYLFTAINHWLVSLLFIMSLFKNEIVFSLPEQRNFKTLSIILIIYGILIYTIVELLLGYTWPGIFTFGALCPTSIFAIGVNITAIPGNYQSKVYIWLLGLLSTGAIICRGRTVLIGGIFDLSYLTSGIIGFFVLWKYREVRRIGRRALRRRSISDSKSLNLESGK